ncbi:MAG: HD domain-containing protein [Clostridia bacterium]|nr:HD domain-containing protein [Clostridia bacterium]
MMELVSEAIIFATKAHDSMRRKQSDVPYILHPMEAAAIVGSLTADQEVIAAAALHDVVEDAGISMQEIEEKFGSRVAVLVASETEDKREELPASATWKIRKEEAMNVLRNTEDIDVKRLYMGDKLANLRSIYQDWKKEGHNMWNRFNQKDPHEQAWYYREIAKQLSVLSDTLAWQEFNGLVELIFDGV